MYKLLYSFIVHVYHAGVCVLSAIDPKARQFCKGSRSKNWRLIPPRSVAKRIWIHASSLGEFEQGVSIIETIHSLHPSIEIFVTFFSPSGYEIRKQYELAHGVYYLPKDTPHNAAQFIEVLNPNLAIFIKYDFWLHHLQACFNKLVPVIFVSSSFTPDHIYFKQGRPLYQKIFKQIDHFFVQDQESAQILKANDIEHVTVAGDTRMDRVVRIATSPKRLEKMELFCSDSEVMVFGSVYEVDIQFFQGWFDAQSMKLIIAPHEIDERTITSIEKMVGAVRYSTYRGEDVNVLILDNIGLLSDVYQYARYVYVGGGFRGALHNLLEPAAFGLPVFFKDHPNNKKFREAQDLKMSGGGFPLSTIVEFNEIFLRLNRDPDLYSQAAKASFNYINSMKGATRIVVSYIDNLLK
ncbi:MAG: hypothetical protein JXQ90_07635 [Cyclobacteriaceae bacterium]